MRTGKRQTGMKSASDAEIAADRKKVADKIREYQELTEGDEKRRQIMKKLNELFRC